MFQDGPTAFVLGAVGDVDPGEAPALDRVIDTPSLSLAVFTIDWRALLEQQVGRPRTRTRIWTNRRDEPDRVIIGIG